MMQERVRSLAYEIYLKNGCCEGRELEHWLEAERTVLKLPTGTTVPQKSRGKQADAVMAVAERSVRKTSAAKKVAVSGKKSVGAAGKLASSGEAGQKRTASGIAKKKNPIG